jgi:hypothetical protein
VERCLACEADSVGTVSRGRCLGRKPATLRDWLEDENEDEDDYEQRTANRERRTPFTTHHSRRGTVYIFLGERSAID